ncbi:MAG TPA: TMEM175 family protein [Anaerolineae bacterium]|nr:TMEM175 family protein [Anaerolineae bacterium]
MENQSNVRRKSAWLDQGDDLSRVLALSDAIFAFALTLLAVDLDVPAIASNLVSQELPREILALTPKFFVFALAFYLVIVKWMAHRRIFQHIVRYDSTLLWINNYFLLFIAFMPVPTAVLGRYPTEPAALIFFGVTQIVTTAVQWVLWLYATRNHHFTDETIDDEMIRFFSRRYLLQILALAAFTVIAVFNVLVALVLLIAIGIGFQVYVSYQRNRHSFAS